MSGEPENSTCPAGDESNDTDDAVTLVSFVLQSSASRADLLSSLGAAVSAPEAAMGDPWLGIRAVAGSLDVARGRFAVWKSEAAGVTIHGSVMVERGGDGARVHGSIRVSRPLALGVKVVTVLFGVVGVAVAGLMLFAPGMGVQRFFFALPLLVMFGFAVSAPDWLRDRMTRLFGCLREVLERAGECRVEEMSMTTGVRLIPKFLHARTVSGLTRARPPRPRAVLYWSRAKQTTRLSIPEIGSAISADKRCTPLAKLHASRGEPTSHSFRCAQPSPLLLGSTIVDTKIVGQGGEKTAVLRFGVQWWEVVYFGGGLVGQLGFWVLMPGPLALLGPLLAVGLLLAFTVGCRTSKKRAQEHVERLLLGCPGESLHG